VRCWLKLQASPLGEHITRKIVQGWWLRSRS
jgi:hypothetical protein